MGGTLKVLVVDDEPGIRLAVARVLEPHRATLTDETEEAALELINSTDRDFSYDAAQRLEVRLSDGKWYVVDDKQDYIIMSIYTLPANGTAEDMFHFDGHYDKLPAGSYRMVKTLTDADGNTALAAAEFDIR